MRQRWFSRLVGLGLIGFGAIAPAEDTTASKHDAIPALDGGAGLYLSAGAGPAFLSGSTGWGVNANILSAPLADLGLYVGADLGATFWGFSAATGPAVSSSATAFQFLPTAIYRFHLGGVDAVSPYLGFSLGPTVYRETVNNVADTEVFLQAMIRPGVFTPLSDAIALQIEPSLGWLDGNFLFAPHANVAFSL